MGRRLQAPLLSSWCSEVAAVVLLVAVVGVVTSLDGMCVVGGCRCGGPGLGGRRRLCGERRRWVLYRALGRGGGEDAVSVHRGVLGSPRPCAPVRR